MKVVKHQFLLAIEQTPILFFLIKWIPLSIVVGGLTGSASAFFLESLNWATAFRENNLFIIAALPVAGLIIGLVYHYWGESVVKGNNQILDEYSKPRKLIPLKMAPMVLFGTVITHLFGGSAGREGTAVQMGGAIADQFSWVFKLRPRDRKILLIIGISAGFASVFGTPLAGTIFALEVLVIGRMSYEAIVPSLFTAVIADYTCSLWGVGHTHYSISEVPSISMQNFFWVIFVGLCAGFASILFSKANHFWAKEFKRIKYPPLRPFVGGFAIATLFFISGSTKYLGLGVPTIVESFTVQQPFYAFLVKILLTSFTLGAGFKGGEVTPLFFVGATLGSALSFFVPLPIALLAGVGFVSVFSGATNTPLACTVMGIELFGVESGVFVAIACFTAYLFSGHTGIYTSQIVGLPKHKFFGRLKGNKLSEVKERIRFL